MKKVLFLLLLLPLMAQAKDFFKLYSGWEIRCTIDHGQIVPDTKISISVLLFNQTISFDGIYTKDGYVECEIPWEDKIDKITYSIKNEEGRLNPKNKNKPQVSIVGISLAEKVSFGGRKYTVTENATSYFLTSEESLDFSSTQDYIYQEGGMAFSRYPIIGAMQSISLEIPKSRLIDMFSLEKREFAFSGQFHAVIIYENGRADVMLSEGKGYFDATKIEKGTLNLITGETIVIDRSRNEFYATTTDGIKLLPGWHKKYETIPYKGETLTDYYHRVYTAPERYKEFENTESSLYKTEKEKDNSDTKNIDKKEADLIAQVEALGETPYQKAVKALLIKYQKRFERECFVSSETIWGGALISAMATGSSKITNMATFTAELAPCLMEATMNRPATCKSIMSDMEKDMKQSKILNLRKPIEHELEELQLKRVNEKLSK